jgi:hypothetical protein
MMNGFRGNGLWLVIGKGFQCECHLTKEAFDDLWRTDEGVHMVENEKMTNGEIPFCKSSEGVGCPTFLKVGTLSKIVEPAHQAGTFGKLLCFTHVTGGLISHDDGINGCSIFDKKGLHVGFGVGGVKLLFETIDLTMDESEDLEWSGSCLKGTTVLLHDKGFNDILVLFKDT